MVPANVDAENCNAFAKACQAVESSCVVWAKTHNYLRRETNMTAVSLEHVSKRFEDISGEIGHVQALDDVSFNLTSGQVLGVVGPSGCGKSTMLRVAAGLMEPDAGQVYYDGVPLPEVDLMDRGIGFVFQEGALIPHWEAKRSVGFYMNLRKRDEEVPERVKEIAAITGIGLEKLLAKRPRQLSGGEKQRVSIARALTRDRRVMLFDEPFANLDAKLRHEARVELKRLLSRFPVTSIYVTHDQVEAISLADRIAVMREGKIEQFGTFQQLYEVPSTLFVASFIGTPQSNVFPGRVEDGEWQGESFGGYPLRKDLEDGTQVTMAIRPNHMRLVSDGVPGVIDSVIPMLAERYQLINVWLGKEKWAMTAPLDMKFDLGSTIYCDLDPEQALYFDTKTGVRIG